MNNYEMAAVIAFFIGALVIVGTTCYEYGFERGARRRDEIIFGPDLDGPKPVTMAAPPGQMRYFDAYVRQLVFIMEAIRRDGAVRRDIWDTWVEPDVLDPVRRLLRRRLMSTDRDPDE